MSLFSKILSPALCCFYPQPRHSQEETRPSTSYDPPSTVARKPMPYAMINVPHQPDTMDEQAFRRMLTASPACPIEAGPISNAQLQREQKEQRELKKRKKQLPRRRGSLDLNYSFSPGSPMPTASQTEPRNTKQKTSKSRLDKKSSRAKGRESDAHKSSAHHAGTAIDLKSIEQAVSAQSAELDDILTLRNASFQGFDSDAEVIKTPEFRDVTTTIEAISEQEQNTAKDLDSITDDLRSERLPSPLPVETAAGTPSKRLTRSSPYPSTPEKISFTDALQPRASESPSVVLKRLSAGIANGSIKPPTDLELQTLTAPISHATADDWKLSLQAPLRWSSSQKEPDTPQTVIRRFSEATQSEEKGKLKENTSESKSDSNRASLVTLLEPTLLEYISRISEMRPLDLTLYNDTAALATVVKEEDGSASEVPAEHAYHALSETKSRNRSSIDVTSTTSVVSAEHNSVHLFNMNIPTRLESRSNATILSAAISENNSKHSLNSPPRLPSISRNSPIRHVAPFQSGRAEHNRKPSDPQTRHLFEQPGRRYHPYWKASTTSINKSKLSQERDDASSIYSTDCGAPPSTSEGSYMTSPSNVRKNVNSLAIGGRSASTEIPIRRSSRVHSCALSVPEKIFSNASKRQNDQLNAAAKVIGKYLDGENEAQLRDDEVSPSSTKDAVRDENTSSGIVHVENAGSPIILVDDAESHRPSTEWATQARRSIWDRSSMNQNFSADSATHSDMNRDQLNANVSVLKQTATDLWNKAYRDARTEGQPREFLSHDDLDTDDLHMGPSSTSPRLRHRSSSILQTPKSALRRSQSADPVIGRALRGGENDVVNDTSRIAKTMKRFSFWQLKPQRQQMPSDFLSHDSPMRDDSEVTKRKSFTTFEKDRAIDLRAAHTPPLSHYLGHWGSFPSHTRAERNGPAGKPDNVLTRNFATEQTGDDQDDADPAPLRSRISTGTLSLMQNTSKKLFPTRSNKIDHTKSKSSPLGSPNHRVEKKQPFLLKRWKRQYRTKSTELRGYMTARGHRSSVSPSRPVKNPDLGTLPNEGLFGKPQNWSPDYVDGASFESVSYMASASNDIEQPSKMTDAATQTFEQQEEANASSVWESVMFADADEEDQRMKENALPVRDPGDMVAILRTSKDLKMPGGFEEY